MASVWELGVSGFKSHSYQLPVLWVIVGVTFTLSEPLM